MTHGEPGTGEDCNSGLRPAATANDPDLHRYLELRRDLRDFLGVFKLEIIKVRKGIILSDNHLSLDALNHMDAMVRYLDEKFRR